MVLKAFLHKTEPTLKVTYNHPRENILGELDERMRLRKINWFPLHVISHRLDPRMLRKL